MVRLRPPTQINGSDTESPEALLISAFLETGEFTPEKYRVCDEDIEAWSQLWQTCRNYANHADGHAPPISYITNRFPDFEIISGINVQYAVSRVLDASSERSIRHSTRDAITALADDDLEAAYEALEAIKPQRSVIKPPVSVFDPKEIASRRNMVRIEVPYTSLQRATGGVGESELWYLAARSRHGKTWQLLNMAASAAATGYRVAFLSLEMPHDQISTRAMNVLSKADPQILGLLRSNDQRDWEEAAELVHTVNPGEIHVYDHTHGAVSSTDFVREVASDYDMVIVDHVGLMTKGGSRAVEDWRIQAAISNDLRAISLSDSVRIVAAAQINRDGDKGSAARAPSASKIWGSDAILQDGDVVITMRRWSRKVLAQSAEKVRDGQEVRFYSWFDPGKGRFTEMTYEQAMTQHDNDGGDYQEED